MASHKAYNLKREKLSLEHVKAITALDAIFMKRAKGLYNLARKSRDPNDFIFTQYPKVAAPFLKTSSQVASQFYSLRRKQAIGAGLTALPTATIAEASNVTTAMNGRQLGVLSSLVRSSLSGGNSFLLEKDFTGMSSSILNNTDRDTIRFLTGEDIYIKTSQPLSRVSQPSGCDFCLRVAYEASRGVTSDFDGFHNRCNCVVDTNFEDEAPLRQEFYEDFSKDYDDALELIASGEAGERVIQVGSKEHTGTDEPIHLKIDTLSSNNIDTALKIVRNERKTLEFK